MIRFVVGGAVDKQKVAQLIKDLGGDNVSVEIKSDIEAAMAVKTGKADYYVGACSTGGGGALAMAMALLTAQKCATVSMPGKPPKEQDVLKAVVDGKVAFGFTNDHIEKAITYIVNAILKNKE
ncbi:DUF2620 domain-containing protein [Thermoanaerobacterium thermosaccharolyticum]|uniref:DUF2620 domain-containing protein n=1 Tax=Thermoanaerobacterium thermosaccharolyticum M0795 TaxID=698948 RepID=L0IIK6_THETR|nr:DUF2620 domain-containing protein [Thermoanaerobacterium thermosaccharolyticum]AGB19330.1 Protein of unknown function DUF2620 [Thermoanaerobacterium thermosaccharolyticum M0795]